MQHKSSTRRQRRHHQADQSEPAIFLAPADPSEQADRCREQGRLDEDESHAAKEGVDLVDEQGEEPGVMYPVNSRLSGDFFGRPGIRIDAECELTFADALAD